MLTGALAIIFLFPMVWTAVSSVSPHPGTSQVDGWGFGNYVSLAHFQAGIGRYIANSAFVAGLTVALTLFISFFGGYAFARFQFPGKDLLFLVTLAILMVPYATLLIPLYVLLNKAGLSNSLVGVALVMTMFQLPFSTFMMRISFESVPRELDEAAMVDGCSSFMALRRVLLPAVKPGLITVGLFAFLSAWNDFLAPLILINDSDRMTLAARGLQPARTGPGGRRLRGHRGRGHRPRAALHPAVPAPPTPLRAWLHVRRYQGMTTMTTTISNPTTTSTSSATPVAPSRGALRPLGLGEVQHHRGFLGPSPAGERLGVASPHRALGRTRGLARQLRPGRRRTPARGPAGSGVLRLRGLQAARGDGLGDRPD